MRISIDRAKEKIFVIVSHANGKIIEKSTYWNFSTLRDACLRKLRYLCFINYDIKFINGRKYAYFYDEQFLTYTNFNKFLLLLERGDILINFKIGVYKNGIKEGKQYDHGISFQIKRNALPELFENFIF